VDVKPTTTKDNPWKLPLSARYRKHFARVMYAQEWAESLQQSHPPSPALQAAIEEHWKTVSTVLHVFQDSIPYLHQYLPITDESSLPPGFSRDFVDWF